MGSLSYEQNQEQGVAWQSYATQLQTYQSVRGSDPDFDNVTAMHWIIDALQTSKQYFLNAINAVYGDADVAFRKLQNATKGANDYVTALKSDAASWDRFAKVVGAMENLVTALEPPFNPVAIFSAADNVAKAYTNDPNATA